MDKKIIWCLVVYSIILATIATASIEIGIDLPKSEYRPGDTVLSTVGITSDEIFEGTLSMHYQTDSDEYTPEAYMEKISIKPGDELIFTFPEQITSTNPSGQYLAVAQVLDMEENVIISSRKPFDVSGTDKFLQLNTSICNHGDCTSRVFTKGDELILGYSANTNETDVESTLIYPDKTYIQIDLPSTIIVEQVGTYQVLTTGSKKGYHKSNQIDEFGVIDKIVVIKKIDSCNADGNCDDNENHQTCPQDCLSGQADNYCDGYIDNICDPDCEEKNDPDCYKEEVLQKIKSDIKYTETFDSYTASEKRFLLIMTIVVVMMLAAIIYFIKKNMR